jgi:hypothetical protein
MNGRATPVADCLYSTPSVLVTALFKSLVSAPFTPRPHDGSACGESSEPAARKDRIVFVIRMRDGEEIRGSADDALTVNENTGVLSVHRVDGFEEVTTHYSPSAWAWVTHRVKEPRGRR